MFIQQSLLKLLDVIFRKYCFSFLLLFILYFSDSYPQKYPVKFDRFQKEDGLAQSSVINILQDSKGFMWFGTYGGLSRFDGVNFRSFGAIENDSTSLPSFFIQSSYRAKDSTIWFGTDNGIVSYNPQLENFIRIENPIINSIAKQKILITSFLEDSNNNFWITTLGGGLLKCNKKDLCLEQIKFNYDGDTVLVNTISDIFEDSKKNVWIASDGGIIKLDTIGDKHIFYRHDPQNPKSLSKNNVLCIDEDQDGNLWFGTWGGGLNKFDKSKNEFTSFLKDPNNPKSIGNNIITALKVDTQNNLWVGTYGDGLCRYNPVKNTFDSYKNTIGVTNSLSDNTVISIYEDNSGSLWVGTMYGGVNFIDKFKNLFEQYSEKPGINNALKNNHITSLAIDSHDFIWIGTWGGGINRFDPRNGSFEDFSYSTSGEMNLTTNLIKVICVDSDDVLWIGSVEGVEYRKISDNKNVKFSKLDIFEADDIVDITEDSKGNIWIASRGEGIYIYNKKSNTFEHHSTKSEENTIVSDNVNVIYEDKFGNMWIGSRDIGLYMYDPVTRKAQIYSHNDKDSTSVSSDNIFCIYHDALNQLWIGTGYGINKFSYQTKTFTRITEEDGLVNNSIFHIEEDASGNLWLSSADGIGKISTNGVITNFGVESGLQGDEFMERAGCKSSDGKLYFGGTKGFNAFQPNSIIFNTYVPEVVITQFDLHNQRVDIGDEISGNLILRESVTYQKEIVLNHDQNYFSLSFVIFNYSNPSENHYSYILEGYDAELQYPFHRNVAYYTNVAPGEYTFRVRGANNSGIWSDKEAVLTVIIVPPFYQTLWFKILIGSLLLVSVFYFYRRRVTAVERLNEKLEAEVAIRTIQLQETNQELENEINIRIGVEREIRDHLKEIEKSKVIIEAHAEELKEVNEKLSESEKVLKSLNASKDKFFSIIAHDLRNPFTTLLGYTNLLMNDFDEFTMDEVRDSVVSINKMANSVYSLLDNLLKWSSIHTGRMVCIPENIDIYELSVETTKLLTGMADKKNIVLLNKIDVNTNTFADKQMVDTVLRNLISNAIKFTHDGGSVTVKSKTENGFVNIIVEDTGVGMTQDVIEKLFRIDVHHSTGGTNNEKGSGLGLILCKEMIEKNGGEIWIESEVGSGSKFIFRLPSKGRDQLMSA